MAKIIFLDIDGVLNSHKTCAFYKAKFGNNGFGGFFKSCYKMRGGDIVEPSEENVKWGQDMVDCLRLICDKTDAKIVISSTWRISHDVDAFIKMFKVYGWENAPVIDLTANFPENRNDFGATRGQEILEWIENKSQYTVGSVDRYIIIDDSIDFLPKQMKYFIKTSMNTGLNMSHVRKAISILNG